MDEEIVPSHSSLLWIILFATERGARAPFSFSTASERAAFELGSQAEGVSRKGVIKGMKGGRGGQEEEGEEEQQEEGAHREWKLFLCAAKCEGS